MNLSIRTGLVPAILWTQVALSGCQATLQGNDQAASTFAAADDSSGYFVALTADPTAKEVSLYDLLYDTIDAENRKRAADDGRLGDYLDDFEADGDTQLAAGDDEIECDRQKCLVKVTSRTLTGRAAAEDPSLAALLTDAMIIKGAHPTTVGSGANITRTYTLGHGAGLEISCTQVGVGDLAVYRCDFDLDQELRARNEVKAEAALATNGRGKLVNCVLSPGTHKSALDAAAQINGAVLLELTASAVGGHPVGYVRYVHQGKQVEFQSLYLCGDLSHDTFQIEGVARHPGGWLPRPVRLGATLDDLATVSQDEARIKMSTQLVEESAASYTLDVHFKLVPTNPAGVDAYGADHFYIKLDKAWAQ